MTPSATLRDSIAKFVRLAAAWNLSVDQATDRVMAVIEADPRWQRGQALITAVEAMSETTQHGPPSPLVTHYDHGYYFGTMAAHNQIVAALRSIKGTPT